MRLSKFTSVICLSAAAMLTSAAVHAESNGPTRYMKLYWERATASCNNKKSCQVAFKTLTSHVRIEKVSCNFYYGLASGVNHPTGFVLGRLGQADGFEIGEYLEVGNPISVSSETIQFQPHQDTLYVVPKTWKPAVVLNITSKANISMECTIAGTEAD